VQDSALVIYGLWISGFCGSEDGPEWHHSHRKKAGVISAPALQLVCARIKLFVELCSFGTVALGRASARRSRGFKTDQALRRGRTVKSRTCARMLDICIPFSCATKGNTSATN
jgi:hypothetical protein